MRRRLAEELSALGLADDDRPARQSHRHDRRATRTRRASCSSPIWTSSASSCARSRRTASSASSGSAACRSGRCAAQEVLFCVGEGRDVPGVIANKSHHATPPEEKYRVAPLSGDLRRRRLLAAPRRSLAAGIDIGTPVVYAPKAIELAGDRIAGTSVDDRAGCAVIVEVARALAGAADAPDRASRLLGAGGVQPARRGDGGAGACSPTSPSSSTSCSRPTRPTWRRAATSRSAAARR